MFILIPTNLKIIDFKKSHNSPSTIEDRYFQNIKTNPEYELCFTDGFKIETQHSEYAF